MKNVTEITEIGMMLRVVSNLAARRTGRIMQESGCGEDVTALHGAVICYIRCHDGDVFQRDIEREFGIRRSTVSGILQLMERNGLIIRTPVESDGRLKKISLTDRAIELQERIRQANSRVEADMSASLTDEERRELLRILGKLALSLDE